MVTLTQQKYNSIAFKWKTRVLYQAQASARPNLSSTAASYVCVLQSSRMRAEQHKLVRSLWRRILEVGWALVLCVLGVHGHFDTTEIQSNFTQVENTCAGVLYLAQALAQT